MSVDLLISDFSEVDIDHWATSATRELLNPFDKKLPNNVLITSAN